MSRLSSTSNTRALWPGSGTSSDKTAEESRSAPVHIIDQTVAAGLSSRQPAQRFLHKGLARVRSLTFSFLFFRPDAVLGQMLVAIRQRDSEGRSLARLTLDLALPPCIPSSSCTRARPIPLPSCVDGQRLLNAPEPFKQMADLVLRNARFRIPHHQFRMVSLVDEPDSNGTFEGWT